MGAQSSKEIGGGGRRSNDIKPGVPVLTNLQLPGPLSLKEYKARLATSEGAQTFCCPQSGLKVKYAFVSLRGLYPSALDKPNQDSLCIHTHYGGDPEQAFFGIFDGHGEFGTECSQFAKDKVPKNLLNSPYMMTQPEKAFRQAMVLTNKQMHRQPKDEVDDSMSGTTAITLLLQHRMAYVANVGDSRAVLAERQGKQLVAQDLSFDQTPFRRDECERVKKCGARVLTLDQLEGSKDPNVEYWGKEDENDGDPPRLWAPDASYPGTAFTRSLGDRVAEGLGVTAEPEVLAMELTPAHPFLVLASDGVWEFMPSQEVVDVVARFEDPHEACLRVVTESYRLWLEHETRTDDISMIVVQFDAYNSDPVMDPSYSKVFSGNGMPAAAGMSASFSPEPSSAFWLGPVQSHLQPQLSSLSVSTAATTTTSTFNKPSTPFALPPSSGAISAPGTAAGQFMRPPFPTQSTAPPIPPITTSQSRSAQRSLHTHSFSVPQAHHLHLLQHTHSYSFSAAPLLPQQSLDGLMGSNHSASSIISESVAFKRKLEIEVEHQQQLKANLHAGQAQLSQSGTSLQLQGVHGGASSRELTSDAYGNRLASFTKQSVSSQFFSLDALTSSSFMFEKLSLPEKAAVFQAFQQIPIKAGQLVTRQGGPGDYFYVIQSGIYDVYLQEESGHAPLLVRSYGPAGMPNTPAAANIVYSSFPYFGELALLYRRPRAATVMARTDGILWSLHRNDFKACLQHRSSPPDGRDVSALVQTLREVQVLECLNGAQLRALAETMEEAAFEDGQLIIQQGQEGQHFFVVQSGEVVCSARRNCADLSEQPKEVLRVYKGQYFGERALLTSTSSRRAASAHACGRVVVFTLSRSLLEQVLGAALQAFIDARLAWESRLSLHQQLLASEHRHMLMAKDGLALEDLQAQGLIFSTDCSALMLMEHTHTEEIYTVRLTSVADVMSMGKQALLMRSRALARSLEPSFFIPSVLKSFKDCRAVSEVLTCVGLCTLDALLGSGPLDELSAMFVAASVLLGLEHLHHSHIIYRGLSLHSTVVTEAGHLQLVDLWFARKDSNGRACTLCGDPEYLAPEMVESRGHTSAVDLWALGVLIYCLLSGSTPFLSPDGDELETYRKVCSRSLSWPSHFSPNALDIIDGLLQLQPNERLGTGPAGIASLKRHPWFAPIDWDALMQLRLSPPPGMLQRINDFEGVAYTRFEPPPYTGDLSWLDNF